MKEARLKTLEQTDNVSLQVALVLSANIRPDSYCRKWRKERYANIRGKLRTEWICDGFAGIRQTAL